LFTYIVPSPIPNERGRIVQVVLRICLNILASSASATRRATTRNYAGIIRVLIRAEASDTARGADAVTPLMMATHVGDAGLVE
jgi:hypothetical protein